MAINRLHLAQLWSQSSRVSRSDIFTLADKLRPTSQLLDVETPAVGFLGSAHDVGGTVVLTVNPAGGKDTSEAGHLDPELYRCFRHLRAANKGDDSLNAFEEMNAVFAAAMPGWSVYQNHTSRILSALSLNLEEIAYLYLIPFRTRHDEGYKMKTTKAGRCFLAHGYRLCAGPILEALKPNLIVALDSPSNEYAQIYAADTAHACEVVYYTRQHNDPAGRDAALDRLRRKVPNNNT